MSNPCTKFQIPDQSILDHFDKQNYLGNRFVYAYPSAAVSTTSETAILYISNPAANTKSLFLVKKRLVCLTASQSAALNFYQGPTISDPGATANPVNLRTGSANASVMALSTAPTASPNGTYFESMASNAFATDQSDTLVIVDPGSSLLITAVVSANSAKIAIELVWDEI